jgi:hypothetical protein
MRDFLTWAALLLSQWQHWASGGGFGGAAVLILYLLERILRWAMPKAWYLLIFVGFFILGASFMVWRAEHKLVEDLNSRLEIQQKN